ncbi:MAG TPA: hypothetical protein HPP66_02360 [Planctomycetes bacterium]|nr:hypothetical protein [Planctomycetota bacterium]
MEFADFVCFDAIIPELKATDHYGAIAELVSALDKADGSERVTVKRLSRP